MQGTGQLSPSDPHINGSGQAAGAGGGGGSKEGVGRALTTASGTTFRVEKSGRGPLSMDHTTTEKTHAAFGEFKENLLRKMSSDDDDETDYADASVSLNFATYTATALTRGGQRITVDLTRMLETNLANSVDSRLYNAAQKLQKVIADAGLIEPTSHSCIMRKNDQDYVDVLGDPQGPNGFVQSFNQMESGSRQRLAKESKNAFCRELLVTAGFADTKATKIITHFDNIVRNHKLQSDELKLIKTNLTQEYTNESSGQARTKTAEQLEELKKDVDAIDKKITEIALSEVDQTTLMLVLTATYINSNSQLNDNQKKAKALQNLLEHHFTETLHIGKTKRDPKTKRASTVLTKPYKEYAAMIAAAAVFSKGSYTGEVHEVQYDNHEKMGYQDYLSSEKIDPRSNLGAIGALLRNYFDDNTLDAQNRNWNNLYVPKEVSQATRDLIIASNGPVQDEL